MIKIFDLKIFLEENRLGEYLDRLQAEGYEIQDLLESGDESLLELVGGKKAHLERLKRGLANLSANDSPIGLTNKLLELAGELPMVLAVPALEFCDQNLTPVLRLWALCDFVELSARLTVIVGIAEHGGKPPEKLRVALSEKIERPTLGQWLHMARATAEHLPENPAFSGLTEFISHLDKELCPLNKSQDFKRSVLALRNRLAHGGGLNKTAARDILLAWEDYVARLAEIFAPWRDFQMVSSAADRTMRILQGAEPKNWTGELLRNSPGAIYGIIGDRELNLWPLLTDSRDDEDIFSGIYSRRGEVRLEYTPFEGDLAVLESEVPESFLDLLRRDTAKVSSALQHQEFTAELQKEAARRIGRAEEFSQLLHRIGALPTGGLLWVGGVAGMGKSCLMASVTVELMQCPPAQTLILPYRFKAGGGRCSLGDFLGYAAERVEAWIGIDQERSSKINEDASLQTRFMELLRCVKDGWDILVVADGLDELPAQSDTWLDDVIISSAKFGPSRVRWALAGRPERGIPEKLSKAGAVEVFPAGLPPMKADDVRSFFFERLSRSKMRSRLIARDEEKDGATVNPFLREVVRRSEGLPVYMNHVVGDLIANKITPDQEGQLPKGITAYHEELLRRCAVGDLQAVMTPIVAILALAHEPLGVPALASILRSAGRLDTDNINLVEKALAGVASMIRRAATPEGTDGYTLYHTSLRQHVCTAESFRETIPQMRRSFSSFCAEAMNAGRKNLLPYIRRHGVEHFLETQDWDNATAALSDLEFIEARAILQELSAMLKDYAEAVKLLPDGEKERQTEAARQVELDRYAKEMIEYSATWSRIRDGSGEPEPQLPCPLESVRLWTEEEIAAERKRMTEAPNRLDIVKAFQVFVSTNFVPLQKYSFHESFILGLAINHAPCGPVAVCALRHSQKEKNILILKKFKSLENDKILDPNTIILDAEDDNTIWSVDVDPTGQLAVSGSNDGTIRVWDLKSLECLLILRGHRSDIKTVKFIKAAKLVVSGSSDETIRIWSLDTGECLKVLSGHDDIINSIDFTANGDRIISASSDKKIRVWDVHTGNCLGTLEGHTDSVYSVLLTADGQHAMSSSCDGTIRVWDLNVLKCVKVYEGYADLFWKTPLAISLDAKRWVFSGSRRFDSGAALIVIDERLNPLVGHIGSVIALAITPDGRRIASAGFDRTIRIWDAEKNECIRVFSGHKGAICSISITPDGRNIISVGDDGTVRVWDARFGDSNIHEKHTGLVNKIGIIPSAEIAVMASYDHTLRIWEIDSGKCLRVLGGHSESVISLVLSDDGKRIISGSKDKTLRVWDVESGECLKVLEGHKGPVNSLVLCADGRRVISGSKAKTLRVWDVESGECLKVLKGHNGSVNSLVSCADGRRVISGSSDNTIRVWDVESGECLKVLKGHMGPVNSLLLCADGKRLVSGIGDDVLRVWDIESGKCLHVLTGHNKLISALVVTPDGRRIVSGGSDKKLIVWDIQSGECIWKLKGHSHKIDSLYITEDGSQFISFSEDCLIMSWDLKTGFRKGVFFIRSLFAATLGTKNKNLVIGTNDGLVDFFHLQNLSLGPFITTAHREILSEDLPAGLVTARPPCCGQKISISDSIADRIDYWAIEAANGEGGYIDPDLLLDCPNCGTLLRMNPFFVDINRNLQ